MANKRLLVVDDQADIRQFVRTVAEQMAFDVTEAGDGREFMNLYDQVDPDIIVLDIVMPDVNGLEIVQWLTDRQSEANVVILTGDNPLYARAAEAFAEAKGRVNLQSLRKPVRLKELRDALSAGNADSIAD